MSIPTTISHCYTHNQSSLSWKRNQTLFLYWILLGPSLFVRKILLSMLVETYYRIFVVVNTPWTRELFSGPYTISRVCQRVHRTKGKSYDQWVRHESEGPGGTINVSDIVSRRIRGKTKRSKKGIRLRGFVLWLLGSSFSTFFPF